MDLNWHVQSRQANNPQAVVSTFDFEEYDKYLSQFANMKVQEKSQHKSAELFYTKVTGKTLDPLMRKYAMFMQEWHKQQAEDQALINLRIDSYTQRDTLLDLLRSFENINHIKKIYKEKKHNVSSDGVNSTTSEFIIDSLRQGRSLLEAGQNADLLTKPLIYFYAATAYSYAIIILNSPIHKGFESLKGSHGHSYYHMNETMEFGGDSPTGTFTDLLFAQFIERIYFGKTYISYSLLRSLDYIQSNNISISILALLSMVPEIKDYYQKVNSKSSVYNLDIETEVSNSLVQYIFKIGNNENRPAKTVVESSFPSSIISENQGKWEVKVKAQDISDIKATIYSDCYNKLWYIESPISEICIPEFCLHYLIISGFSNIMRYNPHEWGNILSNKTSPEFSLLVRRYIRVFEQKFPILLTQLISSYRPQLSNDTSHW